jgi:putative multiple sugar transport system substrate-binding protein
MDFIIACSFYMVNSLFIASIDGSVLSNQLADTTAAKIPVSSYDRLLMQSPNVDYSASTQKISIQNLRLSCRSWKLCPPLGVRRSAQGVANRA